MHDVDEDVRTICNYGGHWNYENIVGITLRTMGDAPDLVTYIVASKK